MQFEGDYINGEKNGKGKECVGGRLQFKGEYKNGKRNGKGKQYSFDPFFIFKGEYINGEMWNGKAYHNGILDFEIKNGNGKVKEYDVNNSSINNSIKFEGEYINGKRNGKGKEHNDKSEFEGEYINGIKNGKGKEYNKSGQLLFEGE